MRTIEAVWTESAAYTEAEGGGTLELRGNVHGESRPSPLEFSTIDADAVTLEFRDGPPVSGDEPTRESARLSATGNARLENRTWQTPDHAGLPRVFHVAGDRVDYDQRTLEAPSSARESSSFATSGRSTRATDPGSASGSARAERRSSAGTRSSTCGRSWTIASTSS